uniref:histidine kinase n=1 Tax=Desulfatirhabdium butyrativorans TaxID=340467 RepID=A0A7C4RM11_9BACT
MTMQPIPKSHSIETLLYDEVRRHAALIFWVMDSDHRVVSANAFSTTLIGHSIEGKHFRDVVVDFENRLDPNRMAQDSEKAHLIHIVTKDRLPQSFSCTFHAIDTGVVMIGSIALEEQERLKTEILSLNQELSNMTRALQKANAELKHLNELKNQFLGMAAHDLRKPVGIIMAYADFLEEELASTMGEEQQGFLRTIQSSARFMKRIIDNFLDAALIDSGRFEMDFSREAVQTVLDHSLAMVSLAARRKSITIDRSFPLDLPTLMMDGSKIEQVVMNVLANAVEYSPPGSRIEVSAGSDERVCTIRVTDQGPGIPREEIQHLFQAYGRASARKTAGERSIGLGLAISRKIVEQHGGTISVTSEIGKGSTFEIRLPLHWNSPEDGDPSRRHG